MKDFWLGQVHCNNRGVLEQNTTIQNTSKTHDAENVGGGCNEATSPTKVISANSLQQIDEYNIGEVNSSVDSSMKTEFENLICIEIFSGSGKLTASIRKLGMRAVAVDRSSSRTSGPVTILDLTKEDDIVFLEDFIESEKTNIMLVHLAPPCGTSSAARNKRHPDLELAGYTLPKPLRSEQYPIGLPTLRGLDAAKVQSANTLYWATYRIATLCIKLRITVSIENPQNSLFWLTDPMTKLFSEHYGYHNVFQACMMGGDRDKRTWWWCSDETFDSFNILCDGMHKHKAWKPVATQTGLRFPTAQEAEYPALLCERKFFFSEGESKQSGIRSTYVVVSTISATYFSSIATCKHGFLGTR